MSEGRDEKDPFIAALLSLFLPGAGQLYLRQTGKGSLLIVLAAAAWFALPAGAWALNVVASVDAYQVGALWAQGQAPGPWQWFWNRRGEG